jgi:predicted SAM-dependent methyltransferase
MESGSDLRLHVGCGALARPGWVNIDNQALPGVDRVLDVRQGLPFSNAKYIYAEHFLEHLGQADALNFLRECRRVLRDDGVLRLSTPNLTWVWVTQYHPDQWRSDSDAINECFWINRGFHGWGHQFLYNLATLRAALLHAGFGKVVPYAYGESDDPMLRGLEQHPTDLDTPELPHIVIVEASGRGDATAPDALRERMEEYEISLHG